MKYRLLALDLDGTVVEPNLVIREPVREAIAAAQAAGVQVVLATGRTFGATLPFVHKLNIDGPVICYQGAVVRHPHTGEVYHHLTMPTELVIEAITLLQTAGIFLIVCIDERSYVAEHRPELDLYLNYHPEGVDLVVEPDLLPVVQNQPATKILFVAEPDVIEREVALLAAHFEGRLGIVRSHSHFGELVPPGVSKGVAVAALADQLGIPREEVAAIGDQENDVSMIAWAGLGLAMGNAVPAVKAVADAVLPPVTEAGVAWGIERYILA